MSVEAGQAEAFRDESIAALGAGRMGRSIGAAFALAGRRVTLIDLRVRTPQARAALRADVDAELRGIYGSLQRLGLVNSEQIQTLLQRVDVVDEQEAPEALRKTTVVFEAVPETLEAKRDALARACRHLHETAVIASTSSTILTQDLAALVTHPERFLNAHWLNPAYLVPLVEVAPHAGTAAHVRARLVAMLEAAGKVPVLCGAQPGYIVPRLQVLVMNEAARMIEQGVATAEDIDKAVRYGFGMRYASMGIVEFIDFGGLDTLYHASRYLTDRLADARYTAPANVDQKMAEGATGMRAGKGFYEWTDAGAADFRDASLRRYVALLKSNGIDPTCRSA